MVLDYVSQDSTLVATISTENKLKIRMNQERKLPLNLQG